MPGGLPEIVQPVGADTDRYIAAYRAAREETVKLIGANDDLIRKIREVQDTIRPGGGAAEDIGRVNAAIREQMNAFRDMSSVMDEANRANREFNASQMETARLSKDGRQALNDLAAAHGMLRDKATEGQQAIADSFVEQMGHLDRMVVKLGAAKDAYAGLGEAGKPLKYTADNVRDLNDALASTIVHADGVTRALSGADKLRASIIAGQGGYGGAQPSVYYNPHLGGGGGGGLAPAVAQPFFQGGGGGGGGGAAWAALAAAAAGPPGGGWDKGTAGAMWAPVGTFLSTWLPRAHYVLMAANELAATLGPAAVAGGMGALVGMQGGEQAVPRLKAVFSTAESLGGSLGTTAGQYMGLKTPVLQNAQNLATGAAFEGIGATTNILRAGAGDAFTQLGSNTVSMWSQMMAHLTQEFQHGLGGQLGGVVSGGTGYLSQFGNVFGNLGHLFLNAAPNLPGLGGDYLSILQGTTKGLSATSGWLGGMLGPLLAAEAGGRVGTPFVGGIGALLGKVGGGVAGLGDKFGAGTLSGLSAADAAAIAGETGVSLTTTGGRLSGLLGKSGVGIAKAGGALGALSAPQIALAAAAAFTLSKGYSYQTPMEQRGSQLISQINQQGLAAGIPSIIAGMQQMGGVSPSDNKGAGWVSNMAQGFGGIFGGIGRLKPSEMWHGVTQEVHGGFQAFGGLPNDPGNYTVAQQKLQQLSETLVNAFGAGAQVSDQWKKLTGSSLDMGKAFDVATMAQLQLGSAFEKNGKLTDTAKTMIANLQAGYAPMNMNSGQFGGAVAAQTAMSGLQHTQIASVNQAYDQLTSLVQGGASSASTLFGMLGGTPTASTKSKSAGINLTPPPAFSKFAKALGSFTSASGAAAWNTLTNTQSGMLPALEGQLDWLREAQTMGALGRNQTTSMAGYDIAQMLPVVGKNPAALAMLSTYAQQFGGPGFAPGTSGASMQKSLSAWVKQNGLSNKGYNSLMTTGTEGMANIGKDAQQFVQQVGSGIGGALAQGIATHGAQLQDTFMNVVGHKGTAAALGKYDQFLKGSGVPLKGAQDMITYAAKLSGAGPAQINAMMAQVKKDYQITVSAKTQGTGEVASLNAAIKALQSKAVTAAAKAQGAGAVAALAGAIAALQSKTVTVTTRLITVGGALQGFPGIPVGVRAPGHAAGYMVPGTGAGDHVPALLEPGEAVVPRYLVPLIAPILKSHHVPGFAAGGIVPGGSLSAVNAQIGTAWNTLDAMYASNAAKAQISNFWKTVLDPLYAAKDKLKGTTQAIASSGTSSAVTKAANTAGAAIVNQIVTSMNYARGVAGAALAGQGYGTGGLLGTFSNSATSGAWAPSMGVWGPQSGHFNQTAWNAMIANTAADPGLSGSGGAAGGGSAAAAPQSVQQQLQAYLGTLQSFSKDLGTLGKQGLNKGLISQLVAAGPTSGDALAKSILGGAGGVGATNKLWSQITAASTKLGGTAAGAVYGGHLSTTGGQVSIGGITINVSAGGGAAGNVSLTTAQINQITAQVQAALLKQAKRNRQTGTTLLHQPTKA